MHLSYISPGNATSGCDYAGKVVKVGSDVTGWAVGDRIAGCVHGGEPSPFLPLLTPHPSSCPPNSLWELYTEHVPSRYSIAAGIYPDRGSYAEYLKTESDLAWHIPASMSDTDAATYGIGAVAAMQGLFLNLDVAWPDGQKEEGQNGQVDPGRTVSLIRQSPLPWSHRVMTG